jgi:signal peptidase I
MLKYRIYILAVFYIAVFLGLFSLFSSRGCYSRPAVDDSMPLLEADNPYTLARKYTDIEKLKRGDIIVYTPPSEPDTRRAGRISGLPGDSVAIEQGTLLINSEEPSSEGSVSSPFDSGSAMPPVSIPADVLYVLPDNRTGIDPGSPDYFIHVSLVKGKIVTSLFSDRSL